VGSRLEIFRLTVQGDRSPQNSQSFLTSSQPYDLRTGIVKALRKLVEKSLGIYARQFVPDHHSLREELESFSWPVDKRKNRSEIVESAGKLGTVGSGVLAVEKAKGPEGPAEWTEGFVEQTAFAHPEAQREKAGGEGRSVDLRLPFRYSAEDLGGFCRGL
jgi:hypothetical protein